MIRIETVVCPVDFFPASEAALLYATSLARQYDAGLHIVHVIPPVTSLFTSSKETGETVKAEHEEARSRLATMVKAAEKSGVSTGSEVRFGEIDHEIVNAIEEQQADLVVAGTHGRRGFQRWLMGSVCERLLRRVSIPILTVPNVKTQKEIEHIKHVLVATDLSDNSEIGVWALSIAENYDSEITVLHVTDFVMGGVSNLYRDSLLQGIDLEMRKLLPSDASQKCKVATRVEFGIPFRVILTIAEQEKSDLIVLGTHGKGALERTLLGSTAEKVLRGAPFPVLAIPPKLQWKSREVTTRATVEETVAGKRGLIA
jgi:nucleotide-binding universal stress UspA family protein